MALAEVSARGGPRCKARVEAHVHLSRRYPDHGVRSVIIGVPITKPMASKVVDLDLDIGNTLICCITGHRAGNGAPHSYARVDIGSSGPTRDGYRVSTCCVLRIRLVVVTLADVPRGRGIR